MSALLFNAARRLVLALPLVVFLPLVLSLVLSLVMPPLHAQEWPRVALPRDIRAFDIAAEVALHGAPMRLQGFVSPLPPARLLEQFRQSLGQPLVENALGPQRILGRMQGEFYVSVQIEPVSSGSRGTTAVTWLKPGLAEQARQDSAQWLARLPSGSRMLSDMASVDGGRHSRHLVFSNEEGEGLNRDRLVSALQGEGLVLEREGSSAGAGAGAGAGAFESPAARKPLASGRALFFKGGGRQALATIQRADSGTTTVVLNLIRVAGAAP
jgi:hypothetical protein